MKNLRRTAAFDLCKVAAAERLSTSSYMSHELPCHLFKRVMQPQQQRFGVTYEMASSCMHNLRIQQSGGTCGGRGAATVLDGNPSLPLQSSDAGDSLLVSLLIGSQSLLNEAG